MPDHTEEPLNNVIPAKAGIHRSLNLLDPRFRGDDGKGVAQNFPKSTPPSLLRRLTAMLYDLLLVVAVVAVVNGLALGVQVMMLRSEQHFLAPWVAQLLTLVSVCGFFILFWLRGGQTLGMRAWRIKLAGFDGGPPTLGRALLRCLGACLSIACGGLGYWWCLVDPNKRYWHDYLSRTELILVPRESTQNNAA